MDDDLPKINNRTFHFLSADPPNKKIPAIFVGKGTDKKWNVHEHVSLLQTGAWPIHLIHIDHNAPCLPPKFCITVVLDFSWDDCNTQEKFGNNGYAKFCGVNICVKVVNIE